MENTTPVPQTTEELEKELLKHKVLRLKKYALGGAAVIGVATLGYFGVRKATADGISDYLDFEVEGDQDDHSETPAKD